MLPDFSALVQERTEVVVPLTSEELEQAIRYPAERVGGVLEEGLVTTIVADVVEQPGALPLLQYALTELFERREGRLLTNTAYQSIGGVLGALGKRSEEIYQCLDAEQAGVARQVFLRLVALGEGVEDTRRRVLRSEIDALVITGSVASTPVVDTILEAYGTARLLSFDRDPLTQGPTVEVAHEALLREWDHLRDWLDESRADIRMERVLSNAANEWQEADQDASFLLRGSRLDQFEAWVDTTDLALTHSEQEYLDASLVERRARRDAEAERQAREAALERRSRNFLRALVGVFALAAVAAILLSLYAFNQANLATSRELANAAINNLEVDPERSVLLALQGLDTAYTLEAENALHTAVLAMHLFRTLEGHTEIVQSVAVSPDGSRVAGVGLNGLVIVWDAASGQELIRFQAHDEHAFSVTFSPDGKQIATASEDKTAKIWNAESGEELFTLRGHSDAVNAVTFSPDGRFIATASADTTVKIWDSASRETLLTLSGHAPAPRSTSLHPGGVIDIAFNHDGTRLASGGADGIAILWDVTTGEALFSISDQHSNETFVAISPDGSRLATAGTEGLVKVWDLTSETISQGPLLTINHEHAARSLAFDPDGTRLAAASDDGFARVWDTLSGQRLLTLVGHAGLIDDLAFTPDGTQLVTSSEDKTVKVWDLSPGEEWFTVDGSLPFYNPDGSRLATDFNGITLRDSDSGQALVTLPIFQVPFINHAIFSPDGNRIATGSWDGTAKVWQTDDGQELFTVSGHTDRVWEVNFSPDGSRLVTASHDGTAKVWDANTGSELFTLAGHSEPIQGMAYSSDGSLIATSSWDDTVKIWDAKTGQESITLNAGADLTDVAISPDGTLVAAGGNNAAVTVWDISSGEGQKLFTFTGHTGLIPRLAFSPDGKYVASVSFDGSVKLWDVSSGEQWLTLTAGREPLTDVAFNLDGTRLATGGFEGRVRVYALKLEDLQGIAKSRLTRSLTEQECRKYLHRETCP
jgi:WD40 repeat protein